MSGLLLACLAFGTTLTYFVIWQILIRRVEIGQRRWIVDTLVVASLIAGAAAFARTPGTLGGTLAGSSLAFGLIYFSLLAMAGQSKQEPALQIGAPLLAFTAPNENGEAFDLSSLDGRPVLLKFFRGHW